MKIAILAITVGGRRLAERLAGALGAARVLPRENKVAVSLKEAWTDYDALVCIMSVGIVVRAIAPLCRDKYADPCVVVLDETGKFAVSLLSGHLGGGNSLAGRIARITGGVPVITTASDTLGLTALDMWARDNELLLRSPRPMMTEAAARMVNAGSLRIFTDCDISGLPEDFRRVDLSGDADIIVSARTNNANGVVHFSPRNLLMGIGCNRGTAAAAIEEAVDETCRRNGLDRQALAGCATIDAKIDEQGLLQFAQRNTMPVHYFNRDRLNEVAGIAESEYAMAALGVKAVAEPAAILAAGIGGRQGRLIIRKMKWKDVTTAVAERPLRFKE
jgi:cobalt-precorrin 5A hydrolase